MSLPRWLVRRTGRGCVCHKRMRTCSRMRGNMRIRRAGYVLREMRMLRKMQGNKLYFLRSEINAWLSASTVPEDTPKRRREPHERENPTDEMLPVTERVNGADDGVNHTDMARSMPETLPKTVLQSRKTNKEIPLTLSGRERTRETERPFSPCCSQKKWRLPGKENSTNPHVNITATGSTMARVATYSTRGRMRRTL